MVAVLLVLMALFVLSAPFLVTVRNADQASAESADRSVLRVTLDAADRHALAELSASHPAVDETPYYDDVDELTVGSRFPKDFLATDDPHQVMWGLEAEDVAARIDLASASPHVFANLMACAARLTGQCKDKDTVLEVSDTEGFLPEGVVLVDDEIMSYAELEPTKLGKLTRGLLVKLDADGLPTECGPRLPGGHEVGAFVIDQRAWALCEWRIAPNYPKGKLRAYEGIEQVREAKDFTLAPEFGRDAYLALERTTSTFGHVRAGAVWQRGARVVADPTGEPQYGCKLPVDDVRWFNPGTTVWITDGTNSEYAMVRHTERGGTGSIEAGKLVLSEPLRAPFRAFETVVAPLARTPVNVNTATPEVLRALWTNLKLRGKSARITGGEAEQLVDLVLVSRPFTGFEDFLRRIVLPAAGLEELPKDAPVRPEKLEELAREAKLDAQGVKQLAGFLDVDDARALYKNALNANDNELEFATMPLCFTARDVYQLALRASVNAPSGIERARGLRELTELIVPQRDLLTVWTRQEDFDEAPRLDLAAAGWMSGPVPTSRYDPLYGEIASLRWPTRARAHLGPHDSSPSVDPLAEAESSQVYTFPVRDDEDGWAQLAPYREDDKARRASYAMHFDDESKELEGRYLPDGTAPLDLAKLGWSGAGSLMRGMAASMWVKPRELEEGAKLLDVSGPFSDSDRLSLLFEEGNLVLRVLDGAGDHETSTFKERAEVLFPLSGQGAGVPRDTWSHVQIAVDGTRPDQMAMWVDGRRSDHTPGLTRLTSGISGESDSIPVESTEGFPDKCVLRIGRELIEAYKRNEKSFQAKFQSTGENAGFGGRLAREQFAGVEGEEVNQGLFKSIDHPAGSTVSLYGYSLPFLGNLPSAGSSLGVSLGAFAVARVAGIVKDGNERMEDRMEPIEITLNSGNPLILGWGLDSQNDDVDALILEPADPNGDRNKLMEAFSTSGGYAAILAVKFNMTVLEFGGGSTKVENDKYGVRLWSVEVIRYSGYEGNHLRIDRRGDGLTGLPMLQPPNVHEDVGGRAAFTFWYSDPFNTKDWPNHNLELSAQTMVIPISIPSGGSGGITGFPPGAPGRSEFAQITHVGGDADLTEWVRYDDVAPDGHLVRDESNALLAANYAAHANVEAIDFTGEKNPPTSGGGGTGGGNAGGRSNSMVSVRNPVVRSLAPAPPASAPVQRGQSIWTYHMGEPEDENFLITRAVGSQFQFRGVMGTYSHAHPAGPMVLPVFRMREKDETAGYPGRFDHVTMFLDDPAEPGFQSVVHRAHRPNEYTAYYWADPLGGSFAAVKGRAPSAEGQSGIVLGANYVALERAMSVFIAASSLGSSKEPIENRLLARMSLFPSGELPREVRQGQLGGDSFSGGGGGSGGGTVPSATVDEALFFPNFFGELAGMPMQLILASDLGENDKSFTVLKDQVRTTLGDLGVEDETETAKTGKNTGPVPTKPAAAASGKSAGPTNVLSTLPEHGGLLRMGDELLCYDSYDASGSFVTFTIPAGGRGLLGTDPQPHREEEGISYIGSLPVGILGANIGADDSQIPLLEPPQDFPLHGTVRIEDELVHFSRLVGQILEMPRASVEPGEMDEKGPGLFRGRFGTQRASHDAGTPAILFPFRYWDRWSELADAPEMTYYELACEQPDAYWKHVFWKTEEAGFGGAQLGVLQRTNADTPWDAPPSDTNGLELLLDGKLDGGGNPINVQADRVEWRVFVRYSPDSYDPTTGLTHGWKTTPRLALFGVEYMGPNRTLARVDR